MRQTLSLVLHGKATGSLQDVKVGDRVVVHVMKHADHLMAKEIDLATAVAKKAK